MTILFVMGMILLQSSVVGNSLICTRGEKLHASKEGIDNCILCPRGTFMPEDSHTNRTCYPCTRIENPTLEIEITKCNGTHDAVIDCICDYYRDMSRIQNGKDVCRQCRTCPLPGDTSSSGQSRGTASTTLIGRTENRTRGTSVPTDTRHSHERNEGNRSQNGVTDRQTSVPSDVFAYVALFVTLIAIVIAAFLAFVCTDKPGTENSGNIDACSRFKTPRTVIATILFVLLSVLLIICALLKTGAIDVHHDASNYCVVPTVLAAGGYVIAVIYLTRRPLKPQVKEDRPTGTAVGGQLESIKQTQTYRFIQAQSDHHELSWE